jgi:hypothetical protein
MITSFVIYIRVGVHVYLNRKRLTKMSPGDPSNSGHTFSGIRTTEVQVTRNNRMEPEDIHAKLQQEQYSITISSRQGGYIPRPTKPPAAVSKPRKSTRMGVDKVTWAYTRCAMLFALSLLITWTPSSANRVHGLIYPHVPSYSLNFISALVLPLQGFWNAVIYFSTSRGVWRATWRDTKRKAGSTHAVARFGRNIKETDSTVELSTIRSGMA